MRVNEIDKDADVPPLTRTLRLVDIEDNSEHRIAATQAEMANIARLLDLVSLDDLTLDYRLRRGAGGRVHLTGRLKAQVAQTCVVSLEPTEAVIDVPVEAEFWPAPQLHLVGDDLPD